MAISNEAMNYLRELEKTPNWTKIPNTDERIVKLHALFKVDEKEVIKNKANKGGRGNKNTGIYAVYQKNERIACGMLEECAAQLGIKRESVLFYGTESYQCQISDKNRKALVKIGDA